MRAIQQQDSRIKVSNIKTSQNILLPSTVSQLDKWFLVNTIMAFLFSFVLVLMEDCSGAKVDEIEGEDEVMIG